MNPIGTSSPKSTSKSNDPNKICLDLIQDDEKLLTKKCELIEKEKELTKLKLTLLQEHASEPEDELVDYFNKAFAKGEKAFNPRNVRSKVDHGHVTISQGVPYQSTHVPNVTISDHIPARLLSRPKAQKLPTFGVDAEDRPIFISAFEISTREFAVSKYENMIRRQQALKGTAFQMVKSLLNHPDNVDYIIEILKNLFGRPEQLL
uniref:CSON010557 protein n=1 Tax=Culicoides sonorensis TaxID=179676 RepID=A0A336LER6_CULSO